MKLILLINAFKFYSAALV